MLTAINWEIRNRFIFKKGCLSLECAKKLWVIFPIFIPPSVEFYLYEEIKDFFVVRRFVCSPTGSCYVRYEQEDNISRG